MLRNLLGEYGPSAKLSGQTLVLSLPDALTPVVWSLDLAKDGHGSISLHKDEETREFMLIYSAAKKSASPIEIARYSERGKAVRALVKATEGLEKSGGYFEGQEDGAPGTYAYARKRRSVLSQWLFTMIGVVLLVGLFMLSTGGLSGFYRTPIGQALMSSNQAGQAQAPATQAQSGVAEQRINPPREAVGVPMDADSFFAE